MIPFIINQIFPTIFLHHFFSPGSPYALLLNVWNKFLTSLSIGKEAFDNYTSCWPDYRYWINHLEIKHECTHWNVLHALLNNDFLLKVLQIKVSLQVSHKLNTFKDPWQWCQGQINPIRQTCTPHNHFWPNEVDVLLMVSDTKTLHWPMNHNNEV